MGRPSKKTPETEKLILDGIRLGMTFSRAAARGGIAIDTFIEWRKAFPEFAEAVKKAENDRVAGSLAVIVKAARSGRWQAAAWLLERLHHDEYGRRVHVETGKLTDEQLLARLRDKGVDLGSIEPTASPEKERPADKVSEPN